MTLIREYIHETHPTVEQLKEFMNVNIGINWNLNDTETKIHIEHIISTSFKKHKNK